MSAEEEPIPLRRIIAFVAMIIGMFMAILDIQIVAASLADIQAGLGASAGEISWVQTSYLIAEVIMIPLSGFLARALSTRILFSCAALGFAGASLLCATASNIDQMILYRALQGFIGGGMIPAVFATAYTIFPRSKRAIVTPLVGLIATLAPTLGPTIGGYLSETFSWHWLFLINIIPGVMVAVTVWLLVDFDKPNMALFRRFDWIGLAAMAAFLGSMEFALEEGPGKDWFEDEIVLGAVILMCLGGIIFFFRALTREEPVVDLAAFRNRNFAMGSVFSFALGTGLYGMVYLYPLYLGQIRGYDALMIGKAVFVSGAAMFLTAPLAGALSRRVDPRLILCLGFASFATSCWMLTGLTGEWDYWELFWPQVLRGAALMLCMVQINDLALGTLPPAELKNASGLFNLTRNLGGAVGLAVINTLLTRRSDFHYDRIGDHMTWSNPQFQDQLRLLTANATAHGLDGPKVALSQMVARVTQQAAILSFIDIFYLFFLLFLAVAALTLTMQKPAENAAAAPAH
ncbi:DHA2 family efflux MFS transporter permease subunit [Tropicimonas sp. TH_r6]|uniref:DHA2 family efflux MFS transporter permease subunit n=1 Tax=Tropicimonas sp. TH_r6 TaxID=3082085 RepID=UPI002953080D|nr:DHA2 family efflux MFS transporter permease subunit [Tropicimonas sp. TH_r6]MDV7143426.1 DHA2 family efflux MFS transporter permease subunit [Tropicimonas sp. TH_r6]